MIKLIATDLDGTFLRADKTVSDFNHQAVRAAVDQGILFGIASGRPLETTLNMIDQWGMTKEIRFLIGMNGGVVYDTETKTADRNYLLDEKTIDAIMDHFKGQPVCFHIKIGVDRYSNYSTPATVKDALRYGEHEHLADLYELMKGKRVHKINIVCRQPEVMAQVMACADAFQDPGVVHFQTQPGMIEFVDVHVNKGMGLQRIADHFGIPMTETLAFGDASNDYALLEAAGLGVCMKNGDAACKRIADVVTPQTNEEDAVGHYIFDHVLNADA
ncbi:MAG: HAD family hydrolase [Catenisphaera adipataccumulans]|jgi:Cof subfamily protein (haloacid dehalogenase superfamily)|uniref:HAD family hydrolase n=1 Tax=Catenisphaera adipataccumulans TaxID=700500 RepID=UPI003D92DD06